MGLFDVGLGIATGGLLGEDIFGLDITGADATAEALSNANAAARKISIEHAREALRASNSAAKQQLEYLNPFMQAGHSALDKYLARLGLEPVDAQLPTPYYYGENEGDMYLSDPTQGGVV